MLNSMLIGGPIIAIIAGGWGYITTVFAKIRSIFIINISVEGSLADAISLYCWKNMKRMRLGDRKYGGRRAFVRTSDRYQQIAYEIIGKSGIIFWRGCCPLSIGVNDKDSSSGDSGDSSGANSMLSFTFIRGTFDIDKLIKNAIDLYNEYNVSGFQKKRFYVSRRYGTMGMQTGSDRAQSEEPDVSDSRLNLWDKRLIGVDANDIGQKISKGDKPFEALAYPKEIWDAVKDMERWKESEDWYKEKTIPWKRGWILWGPPGTGKTSLVRAIGEHLDMPIISFSLSSFSDKEFQDEWDSLRSNVPCIALIEDIDTVFDGRKNIVKGGEMSKPLSFDTLLNTIDGISNSDGVFTIITTNKVESLDPALGRANESEDQDEMSTRPGRIDKTIKLDILNEECRIIIAKRILNDCDHLIDELVKQGDGDTGAQFQYRCSKIALSEFWELSDKEKEHQVTTIKDGDADGFRKYLSPMLKEARPAYRKLKYDRTRS